ncbi:shootin-1 isoform X2 [Anguilla anguilla]|uniref:shootin-1 isoform X2 n=1 Tax=Anguilla anguilla TaxID=7936 RepID=UPI0015AA93CE|nr:shootin-1 isoform X2 [Anguilla anguilla]
MSATASPPEVHTAVQQYEGLQEDHQRTMVECERLQKERDNAVRKLKEFQRVSRMVIQEVNVIQESLEIEKSCRQTAEALATKLNRQNRSLKRKSMLYLSHLGPEVITEISLEDEDEQEPEESQPGTCNATAHCQHIISELRGKLASSLDEKSRLAAEVEEAREGLRIVREELLKEKHNNTVLIAESVQQKKLLAKYNRVSVLAVDEYEVLQEDLDLEKVLRREAESFAREMLVEQRKLNRQSQILLQSASPDEALQGALREVSRLTQALETQRLEHQKQVTELEGTLQGSVLRREVEALQRQAQLLEEEKKECEERCAKAQVQAKDLRFTVEELQKKLQQAVNAPSGPAPPPPPPPPPPPLPPPPPPSTSNPLSSLLSMIRKRRQIANDLPLVAQDSPMKDEGSKDLDIRQQAVDEMMQRIKKGVQLRPVSPSNRARQTQKEKVAPDSAIQELKGILDTFRRPTPGQYKAEAPAGAGETELERVLQRRRRCAPETAADGRSEAAPNPFPSSVLDLSRVKRTQPPSQTPQEPGGPDLTPLETLTPASTNADSNGKGHGTLGES